MAVRLTSKQYLTLSGLNRIIRGAVDAAFPEPCWVVAEIAELKCNPKGHCYLELVEKADDRVVAQMRATIWAYEYRTVSSRFESVTGEALRQGMKVLLLAAVSFHEVYGLSLNIRDIDPSYTVGDLARKRQEVIERLKQEGIFDLNRRLPLPLVPQRVAVVSSRTAAGYGDFFSQLDNNPNGYRFAHVIFPSLMQGVEAERSIIEALDRIGRDQGRFDIVAIIRGGGSAVDLHCFDGYALAARVARFPLPVITGIGHEKDDTVVDLVAHTRLKTPTAVAEFLISGLRGFEETILDLGKRVRARTEQQLNLGKQALGSLARRITVLPLRTIAAGLNSIDMFDRDLRGRSRQAVRHGRLRVDALDQAVRHLDPANVLRRGYSITRHKGKVIREASALRKWAVIETQLGEGAVTSIVQEKQERKEAMLREQGQAADLLPGFERA